MNIQDKLTDRPLIIFDCEATGLDVAKDRIVTLGARRFGEIASTHLFKCNPGIRMSDEVVSIHGITNEMCAAWEPFKVQAQSIFQLINGCNLVTFNGLNFDIPLLWEEFYRCGIEWNLEGIRILDAGNVFKKKEERTLSAAVRFYLEREHLAAHDALGDVEATLDVLNAQLSRYSDLQSMSIDELDKFSRFDDRLDLAGKIVRSADGRATYNIGKNRGIAVEDDTGFAQWMLNRDFSANTKMVVLKVLNEIEQAYSRPQSSNINSLSYDHADIPDGDGVPF
jgi:DNA polymerase III subunit epsilon